MRWQKVFKRKAIDTEKDPYLNRIDPVDLSVCRDCGSLYHGKKWIAADQITSELGTRAAKREESNVYCPACQKIKDKYPEGFVTIQGGFVKEHREEILRLINNKQEMASSFNPLEKIMEIRETRGGKIEITTTTDKFAQRIGKILKKTFNGSTEYKWSEDTKLARVIWTRD